MRYESYKDYDINVQTQWLADSGKWSLEVSILKESDPNKTAVAKQFRTDDLFNTEEEAAAACIEHAKKIIDGKVPGASVDDL